MINEVGEIAKKLISEDMHSEIKNLPEHIGEFVENIMPEIVGEDSNKIILPKDSEKFNTNDSSADKMEEMIDYKSMPDIIGEEITKVFEKNSLPEHIGEKQYASMPDKVGETNKTLGNEIQNDLHNTNDTKETKLNDSNESNIENKDPVLEKIEKSLSTPEGIQEMIEKHPEKAELWKGQLEALKTLNDPDATPAEINSAQKKLTSLKGQLMEMAVKDALSEVGFDVEEKQRVVKGESGDTKPDVVAKNNTDSPIEVFGVKIQPGETMSVECKCGGKSYITYELNNHIPNQLSGQEGTRVLLTTSDIKNTPAGLADEVCNKYDANLVTADVSVSDVENAIKEVAK